VSFDCGNVIDLGEKIVSNSQKHGLVTKYNFQIRLYYVLLEKDGDQLD
jgi:hypothetical protein